MGLLSFIKGAGEKLFGASEAQAATADDLKKEVAKHGFNTDGLDIQVKGDKVTVKGKADSTEEAEKITLALDNTLGVAAVESDLTVDHAAKEANCSSRQCPRHASLKRLKRFRSYHPGWALARV